jgi:NitT/TauT family transport system substrate-binding protein
MRIPRRIFLQISAGAVLVSAIHACTETSQTKSDSPNTAKSSDQAGNTKKIIIGYWPIAGSLPLYLALEKGYFKEAGLDVEANKFGGAQQIVEGLIAGRVQASGSGTGSANLALGEILQPGLFKIIASNLCNAQHVLDEIIVAKDSPIKTIADLKGKKVASGPGPQNQTLIRGIFEKNGLGNPQVIPMEVKQHIAAVSSGQVDAAYTLEPTGTIGKLKGITKILETGVIAKYILGNPNAAWFGGSAALSTQFIKENPETAKKYIEVHRRAVKSIRDNPDEARKYLAGYTAIEGDLAKAVPIPAYTMYDEFTDSDLKDFQKFFDYMTEQKVFSKKVDVASLIYKKA